MYFFFNFQMNGIPVLQFYGVPKVKQTPQPSGSLQLVADIVAREIFRSLRFPCREKPSKTIRVQLANQDKNKIVKLCDVDDLLKLGTSYDDKWFERIVSSEGDKNILINSTMKVRKIRCEKVYKIGVSGQIVTQEKHHGWELVVKVTRARRVGYRD